MARDERDLAVLEVIVRRAADGDFKGAKKVLDDIHPGLPHDALPQCLMDDAGACNIPARAPYRPGRGQSLRAAAREQDKARAGVHIAAMAYYMGRVMQAYDWHRRRPTDGKSRGIYRYNLGQLRYFAEQYAVLCGRPFAQSHISAALARAAHAATGQCVEQWLATRPDCVTDVLRHVLDICDTPTRALDRSHPADADIEHSNAIATGGYSVLRSLVHEVMFPDLMSSYTRTFDVNVEHIIGTQRPGSPIMDTAQRMIKDWFLMLGGAHEFHAASHPVLKYGYKDSGRIVSDDASRCYEYLREEGRLPRFVTLLGLMAGSCDGVAAMSSSHAAPPTFNPRGPSLLRHEIREPCLRAIIHADVKASQEQEFISLFAPGWVMALNNKAICPGHWQNKTFSADDLSWLEEQARRWPPGEQSPTTLRGRHAEDPEQAVQKLLEPLYALYENARQQSCSDSTQPPLSAP